MVSSSFCSWDLEEQQIQDRLWEEVLDDPTNVYYNNNIQWNGWSGPLGGLYGEPIYYIPDPIGVEQGHSNMFVVKTSTRREIFSNSYQ